MTNRRALLKMLRFAPAAPLALKAAADKAIGDLVGISNVGYAGPPPSGGISGGAPVSISGDDWKKKVLRFLAKNTLPDWVDEELRLRNRNVGYLDPDIACKRSWSMAVKIATQRERNIQRAKHDALDGPRRGLRTRELEETYGVWI